MIAKKVDYDGTVQLGHSVMMGYFEQDQEEKLDPKKTVFETIDEAAVGEVRKQVRGLLGSFLFRGEDIDKKVQVLSGGERGRLALCKLLLEPYNLLLMDEPTNHLDIKSKNVLKSALQKYEGTLLLVSHDRDFLQGMANVVYEFKDKKIKEYLGDINFFLEQRNAQNMREFETKTEAKSETVNPKPQAKSLSFEDQKKQKSLQNKLSKIETQIQDLEKEIKKADEKLATQFEEISGNAQFFSEYESKKTKLAQLLEDWENAQIELDSF
jgi:ATP-binding cassette subfamily F protein 3